MPALLTPREPLQHRRDPFLLFGVAQPGRHHHDRLVTVAARGDRTTAP
jgi:hypothetical protein